MRDYFDIQLTPDQLRAMSSLALAHMGDCVYEILVRGWLCSGGLEVNKNLHRETVALVRAGAQADALDKILPLLTEEETGVVHRGRNANVHMIPKGASRGSTGRPPHWRRCSAGSISNIGPSGSISYLMPL